MNHEKRSITRTESQGKGRGITIKVVSLKPRPLDAQLIGNSSLSVYLLYTSGLKPE